MRLRWIGFEDLPPELRDSVEVRGNALGARCKQMRSIRIERMVQEGAAAYRIECACAEGHRCIRIKRGSLGAALGRLERVQTENCLP